MAAEASFVSFPHRPGTTPTPPQREKNVLDYTHGHAGHFPHGVVTPDSAPHLLPVYHDVPRRPVGEHESAQQCVETGPGSSWTEADPAGFRAWNAQFLQWLVHGRFGQEEHAEPNNHGSFAAMLVASIAVYVGDTAQAEAEVAFGCAHIQATIASDGQQPAELARTRSWHYSTFNLLALTRLAMVEERLGERLEERLEEQKRAQRGLKDRLWELLYPAIEYILPAATGGRAAWPHADLQFQQFAAADIVRAAARAGHAASAAAVLSGKLELPQGDTWAVRPAPEQLDPVKAPAQT